MSVEILSVSLSDESIDRLADAVAARLSSGSVGFPSSEPQRTQRAEVPGEGADPWGPGNPTSGAATAPAATSATPRPSSDEVKTVSTKNGVQTWRFPPDAPKCDCGQPAGLMSATSQGGKRYKAYRCAKGAGDNWRAKCDFNEWAR